VGIIRVMLWRRLLVIEMSSSVVYIRQPPSWLLREDSFAILLSEWR
jgi:hypothetical protein